MTNYNKSKFMFMIVLTFLVCSFGSMVAVNAEGQANVLSFKNDRIGFLTQGSQDLIPAGNPGPVFQANQSIDAVFELANNTSEIVDAYPKISVYTDVYNNYQVPLYEVRLDKVTFAPNEYKKIIQNFSTQANASKCLITIVMVTENSIPLSEVFELRYVVETSDGNAESSRGAVSSDVKGTKYEEAVQGLMAAGIINGYPDGTFKPDKLITRAEIAKMACSASGSNIDSFKQQKSKFKDVAETHWANAYVSWAEQANLIKGYPFGFFKPNNNITYAEAITIIVRLVTGKQFEGAWPDVYLEQGKNLGITDNVVFKKSSDYATRGDIAIMGRNAM